MPKFRKQPVVIEAFQMTLEARWNNSEWPTWLNKAWNKPNGEDGAVYISPDHPPTEGHETANELKIQTLEGVHTVTMGDFIIQGIRGELYPCKPDIFHATYEPVSD